MTRSTASAPVFAALGDRHRLVLVSRLSQKGPLSLSSLTAGSTISRQAVTKHLRVLEAAGLAHSERSGRETVWQLDRRPLGAARNHLEAIARQWDEALERLKRFVETEG